jgi:hypothetical protein
MSYSIVREGPPPLRPLQTDAHAINRGDHRHEHFFDLPSREYFDALLTDECDRLLVNVKREIHEYDLAEFRIAGVAVISVRFLKPGGNTIKLLVRGEEDISGAPIEPLTGSGEWKVWWSGDARRWCVVTPAGAIHQTNYTMRANALHAASVHNAASPTSTMAGR